jgi:hypothetical protein
MIPDMAGFEDDVKPLFRERDRGAMLRHFDLWSYDDVKANASAILDVLRAEQMPCDGPWPAEQVETFAGWIEDGMAP